MVMTSARARLDVEPDLVRSQTDLPRDAERRGRPDVGRRVVSHLRELNFPQTNRRTKRLTLELSGRINREAIDRSA